MNDRCVHSDIILFGKTIEGAPCQYVSGFIQLQLSYLELDLWVANMRMGARN